MHHCLYCDKEIVLDTRAFGSFWTHLDGFIDCDLPPREASPRLDFS